jgi:FkbM family methyltransferase
LTFESIRYYLKSIITLLNGIQNHGLLIRLMVKRSKSFAPTVKLRTGETFIIKSFMDIWILKETVLDRQYELVGVPLQDNWTIVDIGAAMGDFSIWASEQNPHGRIIAVEPYPPYISLLRINLEKNKIRNVDVFDGALSENEKTLILQQPTSNAVQNSTVLQSRHSTPVSVKSTTLSGLFSLSSIQHCDYMKLDCEGAEFGILFSASGEIMGRIDRICMEVHDNLTQFNRLDMMKYLSENGFDVRITPNPVHNELAYLYAEKKSLTEIA